MIIQYQRINRDIFNGELPTSNSLIFKLDKPTTRFGQFKGRIAEKSQISLSTAFIRKENDYINTLIHEMVHLWQWYSYGCVDHKTTFKAKAAIIANNHGIEISRLTKAAPLANSKKMVDIFVVNNKISNLFRSPVILNTGEHFYLLNIEFNFVIATKP